jgi:hypothetical protein
MKSIVLLLLTASFFANAQHQGEEGIKKTDLLLEKIRSQKATEQDRTELQQIAVALQNRAQQLDEQNRDYKKSLQQIDKAITLYTALEDTLNLAFAKKYRGHLMVRLDKTAQAKNDLRMAIYLYRLKNTGAGVAASQFDLARVFEYENKTDSAIFYANICRNYWKQQDNNLQILVINNMIVYHLLQQNEPEKAELIFTESQQLLARQPVHWQPELDFYFTAMLLFRRVNNTDGAGKYQQLYLGKRAALQREGINAKSYYDYSMQ